MATPRYQQSMNGPYHLQQNHLQSHNHSQQHHGMLPPPHLAAPSFGTSGNTSSASPFASRGNTSNGFERGIADSTAGLVGQSNQSNYPNRLAGPTQSHPGYEAGHQMNTGKEDPRIKNVWKQNLHHEMANLRRLVETYPYIAMDTEFPGIVARPIGSFTTKADYHYQTLRCNVDLLKMIQLGITLFKPDGSLPSSEAEKGYPPNLVPSCTWQFNFHFSLSSDMYASDSTAMLGKAGLDFTRHESSGIDPKDFGALLISSGLVMQEDVKWISFHSGYDFGYLMKVMRCEQLPDNETEFHTYLDRYFPALFDIKYIVKHVGSRGSVNDNQTLTPEASLIIQNINQKSGLQDLANELGIQRVGIQHQAGSDSLLTGQVYFKMREKIFNGSIDEKRYIGQVWGLNGQMPALQNNLGNMNGGASAFYIGGSGAASNGGAPSTPQTGVIGLAGQNQTPGLSSHGPAGNFGSITPGGFGNFQYGGGNAMS